MKNRLFSLFALLSIVGCAPNVQNINENPIAIDSAVPTAEYTIFVVADAGRNGAYDQTRIGEVLGVYADKFEPEIVLNCGDMFHYDGVQSVDDPLFISNFENIYPHGELHCQWWGVLGNHEYRGNTQAVIDYTNRSRRWNIPERYYAKTFEGLDSDSITVLFMDSAPLLDKYHKESGKYPDVVAQNPEQQVEWIDKTLEASKSKWKIVVGHHPIYSYSKKNPAETAQMQERVAAIFNKNRVDISLSGHVHTFQHLQPTNSYTDYFVAPSASLARAPQTGEFTTFAGEGAGFLILGVNNDHIAVTMINKDGKMVYSYEVKKK